LTRQNTPERRAREQIDATLIEAGWRVQSRDAVNLQVGRGVAVREFRLKPGHGYADYLLYVDGQAVGVIEAKKEGETLTGVEVQAEKYAAGMPDALPDPVKVAYQHHRLLEVHWRMTTRCSSCDVSHLRLGGKFVAIARAISSSHPTTRQLGGCTL
jgi:hypothetical protein